MGGLGLLFLHTPMNPVLANQALTHQGRGEVGLKAPGGGGREQRGKAGPPSPGQSLEVSWRLPGVDTVLFLRWCVEKGGGWASWPSEAGGLCRPSELEEEQCGQRQWVSQGVELGGPQETVHDPKCW